MQLLLLSYEGEIWMKHFYLHPTRPAIWRKLSIIYRNSLENSRLICHYDQTQFRENSLYRSILLFTVWAPNDVTFWCHTDVIHFTKHYLATNIISISIYHFKGYCHLNMQRNHLNFESKHEFDQLQVRSDNDCNKSLIV